MLLFKFMPLYKLKCNINTTKTGTNVFFEKQTINPISLK